GAEHPTTLTDVSTVPALLRLIHLGFLIPTGKAGRPGTRKRTSTDDFDRTDAREELECALRTRDPRRSRSGEDTRPVPLRPADPRPAPPNGHVRAPRAPGAPRSDRGGPRRCRRGARPGRTRDPRR